MHWPSKQAAEMSLPRRAISNRRLRSLEGERVAFTAKDYTAGGRRRVVRLSAEEFLRRWVQHVLPRGFVKIRHYGLLANRHRTERLTVCRVLLAVWPAAQCVVSALGAAEATGRAAPCGPACGAAQWLVVAELPRSPAAPGGAASTPAPDTS
jgi:hypothetical protein